MTEKVDPQSWWSLADVSDAARSALRSPTWDHLETGAEQEASSRLARDAYAHWALSPRVLRGGGPPDLAVTLAGLPSAAPIWLAPIGTHGLFHVEGERASVSAAAALGLPPIVSMMSTVDFASLGSLSSAWGIQLYPLADEGLLGDIAAEAIAAGASLAVITVDAPVLGRRVRDLRAGFVSGVDSRPHIQDRLDARGLASFWDAWASNLEWDDLARLIGRLPVPVAVKGVLRGEDALAARDAGAAAVWVSAHGGRQLDWAVAPLDALPEVAEALDGALPVVLDGEIRSGADVAKALALGAGVAAVGRPVLWGLAAAGQEGVERVLSLLVDQLANVLALLGAGSPAGLGRSQLVRVER